jgi:hypothetical protein
MLHLLDIAINASRIQEQPKVLKYLIEGNKNIPTNKPNSKSIITMNDTKQIIVKTNNTKK